MSTSSIMQAQSYLLLHGLERALAENLVENCDIEDQKFLISEEQNRALTRLREDMQESAWGLDDVRNDDLLEYLDLGDLVNLLNRHKSRMSNVEPSDVKRVEQIVQDEQVFAIRRRVMHPVRPMEADDLPRLIEVTERLQQEASTLKWTSLKKHATLSQNPDGLIDVSIPTFWSDEPAVLHNLPVAEFQDTGFIGRSNDRRKLKKLLESDHKVITVVGEGGIGKTALALQVCHDLLEDPDTDIDRIVWVTLKTQRLTADGIREITDAVNTTGILIYNLLRAMSGNSDQTFNSNWEPVLEHMQENRILLVIDNLETLGTKIRDLAIGIPRDSKLMLTSRIGLGELELRYEMEDLSDLDAVRLLRTLARAYNYSDLVRLEDSQLKKYCKRLYHNPLLIKWFVQAVGQGAAAQDMLSHSSVGEALQFCLGNVYDNLSPLAIDIISTLQASRRELSQVQLQSLTQTDHIPFMRALQELQRSNIVSWRYDREGIDTYRLGSSVNDYLNYQHPPTSEIIKRTRDMLKEWQIERDRGATESKRYRYNTRQVNSHTRDEDIAAPHLRDAIKMSRKDSVLARKEWNKAYDLTPQWWEVHRVNASLMETEGRPIYEIEQAFEESIGCKDTDINRYHYAVFLMRNEEFDRALEQIQAAGAHDVADQITIRSIKGLILLRSGRIDDALEELEYAWKYEDSASPVSIRMMRGTQFAEALRRKTEQLYASGYIAEAERVAMKGLSVVDQTSNTLGWDEKLARAGVKLLADTLKYVAPDSAPKAKLEYISSKWNDDMKFTSFCYADSRVSKQLEHVPELVTLMPNISGPTVTTGCTERFSGVIIRLEQYYGFIKTDSMGNVHMSRSSLVRRESWDDLNVGQRVNFGVIQEEKGLHAVRLAID